MCMSPIVNLAPFLVTFLELSLITMLAFNPKCYPIASSIFSVSNFKHSD
jgi:hypothetical protein